MRRLYENGRIYPTPGGPFYEALLTEDGRVLAAGSRAELSAAFRGERINLEGRTLLPSFLDGHGHFLAAANSRLQADLSRCGSFQEIEGQIRAFLQERRIPPGVWVAAQGYDHTALEEGRHPTLALLDRAAPENPLLLQHQSGHVGVVNSLGLKQLGITPETKAPEGGAIGVKDGHLTGYLEENAFIHYQKQLPMPSGEELMAALRETQELYFSYGVTTIQEGLFAPQMTPLYQAMLAADFLRADLVGYAEEGSRAAVREAFPAHIKRYSRRFKLGGYKIFLDGSPQGRTAWMRRPYVGQEEYCGYPAMTDAAVEEAIRHSVSDGMQLLAHCNGDAAAEQYLRCIRAAEAEGLNVTAIRPVLVHGQLLGPDQLEEVKRLGVAISFFPGHVYRWGDVHIRNFGLERAERISPAASALALGIPFTFHQDTPVLPPDMLETIWCAVNRRTKGGRQLKEGISVEDAFRAVTVTAAWQYFEETQKGQLLPGMREDAVVLDRDPFTADPLSLREIRVMETIKSGETVYRREQTS